VSVSQRSSKNLPLTPQPLPSILPLSPCQLGRQQAGDTFALRRALRVATDADVKGYKPKAQAETQAVETARSLVMEQQLPMGIDDAEWQFDKKKLTLFYSSDQQRVDFRDFVKRVGTHFKAFVWMQRLNSGIGGRSADAGGGGFGASSGGGGVMMGGGGGGGKGGIGKGAGKGGGGKGMMGPGGGMGKGGGPPAGSMGQYGPM